MAKALKTTTALMAAVTIVFTILNMRYDRDLFLTLAITFGTIFYHFGMRLLVGGSVNRLIKKPIPFDGPWFSQKAFEPKLYKALKVKRWKDHMPTYNPPSFSLELHSAEEIIQTMCISELGHEIIIVLSFLPLFMVIPFGAFPVFLITSVGAGVLDSLFVVMQRYNRPRMVKLLRYREIKK